MKRVGFFNVCEKYVSSVSVNKSQTKMKYIIIFHIVVKNLPLEL